MFSSQLMPLWRRLGPDALVVLAAVLIRVVFILLQRAADPLLFCQVVDEKTYLADARQWVASGFALSGLKLPFWQPPGYLFILAPWLAAGGSPTGFIVLQIVTGVTCSWMVYRTALALFGRDSIKAAIAAGIAYSFFPGILYYETKLLKPAWTLLGLCGLLLVSATQRDRWWTLRGLLAGFLALLDAYWIVLPVILVAQCGREWMKSLRVIAGFAVLVVPVLILNGHSMHTPLPVSYNGPINLYVGNNPAWEETYNALPGWEWNQVSMRHDAADPDSTANVVERSKLFTADVKSYILTSPGQFIRGLFTKALLVCSALELPRDGAILLHPVVQVAGFASGVLLLLAALLAMPKVRHLPLLIVPFAVLLIVNTAFFPTTRYRVPIVPLVLIASVSLAALPKILWWRGARIIALALVIAGSIAASRVVRFDKWRAFSLNEAAWFHLERGDVARAQSFVDQALATYRLPTVLNTAGQIAMGSRNDVDAAYRLLQEAAQAEPGFPDSYFNKGRVEESMKRLAAAYDSYDAYLARVYPHTPGFTDHDARSSIKALTFCARMDFERGALALSLKRLTLARQIQARSGLDEVPGLARQIEMIRNRLSGPRL